MMSGAHVSKTLTTNSLKTFGIISRQYYRGFKQPKLGLRDAERREARYKRQPINLLELYYNESTGGLGSRKIGHTRSEEKTLS